MLDHAFEWFVVLARALLHAHDHVAIHLQKPPIRIPGEAGIVRLSRHDFHDVVIHPEVEDGVHHSRHGIARTRANRDEQRPLFVAKFFPNRFFNSRQRGRDFFFELRGVGAFVLVKIAADFGCDRESGWDRQTDPSHFGEVRAFAAEQRLHFPGAVGKPIAKVINVTRLGRLRRTSGFLRDRSFFRNSAQTAP